MIKSLKPLLIFPYNCFYSKSTLGNKGFEPLTPWFVATCSSPLSYKPYFAGVVGLEPTNSGVKVRCLTTWLHPKVKFYKFSYIENNSSIY